MSECVWCGNFYTQACHVRDKATFSDMRPHDYHNIVALCSSCHYHFFDQGRMVFGPSCEVIVVLRCVTYRRVEARQPKRRVFISAEYLDWKNERAHTLLKAELRRLRKSQIALPAGQQAEQ